MGGSYFWLSSNLEKYGKFWKNGCFSGRIWPDWGNTAQVDMAGLGSIGLISISRHKARHCCLMLLCRFRSGGQAAHLQRSGE